ncbi:Dehydratase iacD [Cladobotryum mycophilum]|uniref:Dehydratase iacD n=1 Tax=Cladobotryum mycophilum TaxID=491253 RepID=A0ABR0SXX5_9HYPO
MTEYHGEQPLKYTVTHYRQASRTHQEFKKWITEVHLPLGLPIFQRHGALGYTLFFTPKDLNDAVKEVGKVYPTWDFADYDCFIEYTLPSIDTIKAITADPEWPTAIAHQEDWIDVTKGLVSIGYATSYMVDGKIVNPPK